MSLTHVSALSGLEMLTNRAAVKKKDNKMLGSGIQ